MTAIIAWSSLRFTSIHLLQIRKKENRNDPGISADFPYGQFDTFEAYNNVLTNSLPYAEFVNPLMTSMECLRSRFEGDISARGRDIMDRDLDKNPDFYDHNHPTVVVTYG